MKVNNYILLLELLFFCVTGVKKSRNASKDLSKRTSNMCFWLGSVIRTQLYYVFNLHFRKEEKGIKNVYPVFENVRLMSSIISCFTYIILWHQTTKDCIELISGVICDNYRSRNRREEERGDSVFFGSTYAFLRFSNLSRTLCWNNVPWSWPNYNIRWIKFHCPLQKP